MSSNGKRSVKCPTLHRLLILERNEWYGNRVRHMKEPGPKWADVSERLWTMLGNRDLVNILYDEEEKWEGNNEDSI